VAGLAAVAVTACAPPDRPPRLPDPLPAATTAYLHPDTARTRRIAPGVWYRYLWSTEGPWAVHVVEADLRRCELGLDVVRAPAAPRDAGEAGAGSGSSGRALVSEIPGVVETPGTLVAVNGDFFTPEGVPLGPELTDGRLRTARNRPVLAWRPGWMPWVGTARVEGDSVLRLAWPVPLGEGAARDSAAEVIGGYPELLAGGQRVGDLLVSGNPGFAASRHPRTAFGHHPPSGRVWLLVVDGRQGEYSLGMTLPELTRLLETLGATEALNLDGGGSSVMVVGGRPVNRPSDEAGERPVANALVLRRAPDSYCAPGRPRPR
jgi:hypothetical protein